MTTVTRGQHLRLVLEGMGRMGEAMATVEGKPVFVFGGIEGEEVVVEVIRVHRRYIAAEVVEVINGSGHRVQAPCEYFGLCTGCQWQHVDYSHQLKLKHRAVEEALRRVGGLADVPVLPVVASPQQHGYRNHARFTVGPEGRLGFVHRERRRFVDIDRCMLMDPWINRTLSQLQGHCGETTQLSVRYGINSGSWLVQPTLSNPEVPIASGQKHYEDVLEGVPFRVAASSFFQVNIQQAETIARMVRDSLRLSGSEVVVDAYAGVGTFAALLAPYAGRIIAIEESASAIRDAEGNLTRYSNVEMRQGKTETVLAELVETVDALVLDPPRAGCHGQALDCVARLAPARIAYVSCDPETLARDLRVLSAGPYQIEAVHPVDMFAQTYHIECIATLSLKPGHPVTLASASPRREQILKQGRIPFVTKPSLIDESLAGENPEARVIALALAKARHVATGLRRGTVLAADTEVVYDGVVLGKPKDESHAMEMLRRLRGREHQVLTGVAVVDVVSGECATDVETTSVNMRPYTDDEAWGFINSGEAMDKAGAYAVQDPVFKPAASVEGCYVNVVGLPLCLSVTLLRRMNVAMESPIAPVECSRCPLRSGSS